MLRNHARRGRVTGFSTARRYRPARGLFGTSYLRGSGLPSFASTGADAATVRPYGVIAQRSGWLRAGASLTQPRGLRSAGPRARPIQHVWEAPVFCERTSVGLDVHARSVVAGAIDGQTGGIFRARLTPACEHVVGLGSCSAGSGGGRV